MEEYSRLDNFDDVMYVQEESWLGRVLDAIIQRILNIQVLVRT